MKTDASQRKVAFQSVRGEGGGSSSTTAAMVAGGKRKAGGGGSSSEDEDEEGNLTKRVSDRDQSHLKDLLDKAANRGDGDERGGVNDEVRSSVKKTKHFIAKLVDESGGKKVISLERLDSDRENESQWSLHDLAREGNSEGLRQLLDRLAEKVDRLSDSGQTDLLSKFVNEPDDERFTPLHLAARYNHYETARLLIEHGADPKAKAEGDATPLHCCARYKPPPLSARLRANGGRTGFRESTQPKGSQPVETSPIGVLTHRSDRDNTDEYFTCRQSLLDSARLGANASKPANRGGYEEAGDDPILLIRLLIENGANLEATDKAGQTPLHYAAAQGNGQFVQELIKRRANVNATDRQLQTPLHAACCATDSVQVCAELLKAGASVESVDCENRTPLHAASQFGKYAIVQLLLNEKDPSTSAFVGDQAALIVRKMRFGQFIDARDRESNTPLILAIENRGQPVADLLLTRGADANATRTGDVRCLHLASQNGDVPLIELLVDHGAKLDCENVDKQTPLHLACSKDREESARCLIERGADLRRKDKEKRTPLLMAVIAGSLNCVKCILKKSIWAIEDVDKYDRTALFLAAKHNRLDTIKYLLTATEGNTATATTDKVEGATVEEDVCELSQNAWVIGREQLEYPDRDNNTPMHVAAAKGYVDIVEYLITNSASPDAKNEHEKTPIHLAAEEGSVRVVRLLASNEKANKTIADQDEDSNTPLHLAAKRGNAVVAEVLLEYGADVRARNNNYWTPLDYAVERGWSTTTEILLAHKAPVNSIDRTKSTPLHIACRGGNASIVQKLLAQKADVRALDCDNRNCLDLAIQGEHREVVIALLTHQDWRAALAHAYRDEFGFRQTPLRMLIRKFPDLAKMVFDKCTLVGKLPPEHPNYEITYDYELLEDTYSEWEDVDKADLFPYDARNRLRPNIPPYSENSTEVSRNHPLMVMVRHEREELLDHPLVRSLLKHKWRSYGRYVYYSVLAIYLLFLTSLTAYVATARPPYYTDQPSPIDDVLNMGSPKKDFCTRVLENATTAAEMVVDFAFFDREPRVLAWKYLILILSIFNLAKESVQMYLRRFKYFTFDNCIELFVFFAGFVFVVDFTPCSRITGYRMDWQWQLGAFAVFLAWFNLILFASKLPRFGIYVVMFIDVSRTFSQFFLLYFLFIVAFALTFFALFQNQLPFSTVGSSIIKTMVMMVGEYDYEGIFTPTDQSYGDQIFYYRSSNVFFAVFVVVMTILVMNLLIGLAVDDIKSIQQHAVLKRLALQVKQVLEVEQLVPERFRRRWVINQETVYPNHHGELRLLVSKLLSFVGFIKSSTSSPSASASSQQERMADRKLRSLLESTNRKLDQLTRAVEGVQKEQKRLKKLVMFMSEKVKEWDEEEDDYVGLRY